LSSESVNDIPQRAVVSTSTNVIAVLRNSHVVLDCNVTSTSPITHFSWRKDGQNLKLPQKRVFLSSNGSLTIEKFLNRRQRNDAGLYECYATNKNGTLIGAQIYVYSYSKAAFVVVFSIFRLVKYFHLFKSIFNVFSWLLYFKIWSLQNEKKCI